MSDDVLEKNVLDIIKENYNNIFSAERKVANFVLKNPGDAVNCNVSELAKNSGVSDATVIRMCRHIGYNGYYQFRIALARDLGSLQKENVFQSTEEVNKIKNLFLDYGNTMLEIGKNIDIKVMLECVELINNCRYVHLLANGNTCPLSQYMGFRLGRLGIRCTYNIAPEYWMNHINLAEKGDIVIVISKSGSSRIVVQGMELAKKKGLKIIAITEYRCSPVSNIADIVLLSCGKDVGFDYYKSYAHLNETAVIDALLHFVTNKETIEATQSDNLEIMLSDEKF